MFTAHFLRAKYEIFYAKYEIISTIVSPQTGDPV